MGIADEVWMMENSVYSILSPEGFASILWKDSRRAEEAAAVMRMRAMDLKELRVIEKIIPEETPVRSGQIQGVAAYLERELRGISVTSFTDTGRRKNQAPLCQISEVIV